MKNWKKEDKVTLITLLSISLAESSVKEGTPEEVFESLEFKSYFGEI